MTFASLEYGDSPPKPVLHGDRPRYYRCSAERAFFCALASCVLSQYAFSNMAEGKPLIVQSDLSLLLDVHDPGFEEGRAAIGAFAALEKSPEHLHTYRMSALSLWNAASAGLSPADVEAALERFSRYDVPRDISFIVRDTMARFGRLVLKEFRPRDRGRADPAGTAPRPARQAPPLLRRSSRPRGSSPRRRSSRNGSCPCPAASRFALPSAAPSSASCSSSAGRSRTRRPSRPAIPSRSACARAAPRAGPSALGTYQLDALGAFVGGGLPGSGYGVVVMPCGAGKTIVAMAAMAAIGRKTLIVTTNIAAVHQWMDELADKTDFRPTRSANTRARRRP